MKLIKVFFFIHRDRVKPPRVKLYQIKFDKEANDLRSIDIEANDLRSND